MSNVLEFILFADDTNIFFSHKDINILSTTLNLEMTKLSERVEQTSFLLTERNLIL